MSGYDRVDDMLKVKSMQKKFRDSFPAPALLQWEVTTVGDTTVSASGGVLTIASGVGAGSYAELLSRETFSIPFRLTCGVQNGTRNANTHQIIEAVSIDPATGRPDGRNSMLIDIGGAASVTATQMRYAVQNGGLVPLLSSASTITSTSTYSVLELEPFSDEAYFHSRAIDSTNARSNSYVRHQQIPDPNAVYKIRIRSMNHQAFINISNAVSTSDGLIRLTTSSAHGYTGTQTVWIENLNGVTNRGREIRGNYVVTVIDSTTLQIEDSVFGGRYVSGSGWVALAAAPTTVNFQFQYVACQDYAELTTEITAGRGQATAGQAMSVLIVGGASASQAIGQVQAVGPVAHDGARGTTAPVINAGRAITAAYTSVANNDVADFVTTVQGVQIVRPWQIPELEWSYAAASGGVINTADVPLAAAAGSGLRRYITSMTLSNNSGTATEVVLKDGASTVIWRGHLPANAPNINVVFSNPLRTTANTALNFACITTAAAVYVNAQGYTAP